MNLLQINATCGIGSTGRIVKDIHEQAMKSGIHSHVACRTSTDGENIFLVGNKLDHKIHAILCRLHGRQAYFSKRATYKLLQHMDRIKPDVVHIHNLHSNYINLNILLDYIIEKNISLVITLHDCWYYTGKCFHYTFAQCQRWKSGCGSCPQKMMDTPAYLWDKTAKTYNDKKKRFEKINKLYVVGASQWIEQEAAQSFLGKAQLFHCYNGVNTNVFKPQKTNLREEHGIGENDFVILGMANKWCLPQNQKIFNAVCEILDDHTKLVLIGVDNSMSTYQNVIQIASIKQASEMAKWYAEADVFVNLTWEDTLPFVNIEALACGTPVITHKTSGATETIDNQTGILVEQGDIKGLFCAIDTIRENGKMYYEKSCIERAKQLFDVEVSYDKYFQIYEEINNGL